MSLWSKISLYKFQQVEALNSKQDLSDTDKILFQVCAVFGLTEYQLDNAGVKKATKLIDQLTKIFKSPFRPRHKNRFGKYLMCFDPAKMTFGQYVELAFFLNNPTQHAHYILASISRPLFGKNDARYHSRKAEFFLRQKVEDCIGSINRLQQKWNSFNDQYTHLFGLDPDVQESSDPTSPFHKNFGWQYAAEQVAVYERITMDQTYALPVRQALLDLVYLKAKSKHEISLLKSK